MDDLAAFEAFTAGRLAEDDHIAGLLHRSSLEATRPQRDVRSTRAILAEHKHIPVTRSEQQRGHYPYGCEVCADLDGVTTGEGLCVTARWVAWRWSDHPDYRPEWRPADA